MDSVNINEFYNANIRFNIQDKDLALLNKCTKLGPLQEPTWEDSPNNPDNWTLNDILASSGEIAGYTEVGEGYFKDDRVETENQPLCDTTTLSDDFLKVACTNTVDVESGLTLSELYAQAAKIYQYTGEWVDVSEQDLEWERTEHKVVGRWAHLEDADAEELEGQRNLYRRLDTVKRPFGEMEMLSKWRDARYYRMIQFIDSCNDEAKLRRMQQKVWERYIASVKSCAVSKEWFSIYLTKYMSREISSLITAKRGELRKEMECGNKDCKRQAARRFEVCPKCAAEYANMNEHLGPLDNGQEVHFFSSEAEQNGLTE